MKLQVWGCSGSAAQGLHTTTLAVDQDILIDVGTGMSEQDIATLVRIDHVFLTHAHLDHVAGLPLLADITGSERSHPITVYATAPTLAAVQQHLFNNVLWPDFTTIPRERPFVRLQEIHLGETIQLGTRRITAVPAQHVVPAVGYWLDSGAGSLVFSGDTSGGMPFWKAVQTIPALRYLIIENSFRNSEVELARISGHLCPSLLEAELAHYHGSAEILITHLKPGAAEDTLAELASIAAPGPLRPLVQGEVLTF